MRAFESRGIRKNLNNDFQENSIINNNEQLKEVHIV